MTDLDKNLLDECSRGLISQESCMEVLTVDVKNDVGAVRKELQNAIDLADKEAIENAVMLMWVCIWWHRDASAFVDILNELLINPHHTSHQRIAKTLQDLSPHPSTVPFVRKALESKFDYLAYTCSDDAAIAKWFSWLLYAIGTEEAIDLMKEYAAPDRNEVGNEMRYRLKKCAKNRFE